CGTAIHTGRSSVNRRTITAIRRTWRGGRGSGRSGLQRMKPKTAIALLSLQAIFHLDSLVIQDIDERLEKRLGRLHARLRLGIEADHEAQVFGQGINYFHIENLPPSHVAIRLCLKLAGVYGRGHRNAAQIELRRHDVTSSRIPKAFDGFTILQLSDLHVEMSEGAMMRLAAMLPEIDYDLCVLTGDYRAQTFGSYESALAGMAPLCTTLKRPIYGVLGNHDTIRMVPGLEDMGVQMLLNESHAIERGNQRIYLAGID